MHRSASILNDANNFTTIRLCRFVYVGERWDVFCRYCGAAIPGDSQFCPKCGHGLEIPALVSGVASESGTPRPMLGTIDYGWSSTDRPVSFDLPPFPAEQSPNYAGWGRRVLASLIDSLVCMVFVLPAAPLLTVPSLILFSYLFLLGGPWLYFAFFESSRHQATLGKQALGLRVADSDGRRLSFWRATGRFWVKGILMGMTLGLETLVCLFTKKQQTLHDLAIECIVIRDK